MERSAIIKRTGIASGSFIVIVVAMFFLYPSLNKEKYDEIIGSSPSEQTTEDTGNLRLGGEFEYLSGQVEYYKNETSRLLAIIDSLQNRNEEMKKDYEQQIADLIQQKNDSETVLAQINSDQNTTAQPQPNRQAQLADDAANIVNTSNTMAEMSQEEQEEFFDRVKSFLNLDEEELAPIVSNLDNEELVRLYRGGGTIQREKLLRSLKPERAAEIMKVIML